MLAWTAGQGFVAGVGWSACTGAASGVANCVWSSATAT